MARSKWINKKNLNRKLRPAAQNPNVTKFRDQAKSKPNKLSNRASARSMKLTADNLAIHDSIMGEAGKKSKADLDEQMDSDDQQSIKPLELMDDAMDNRSVQSSFSLAESELAKAKGFTNGDQLSDAQTFATHFTNCTNASFNYFLQKFNSNSSVHKEMLSILAAATDIITDQKDEETDEKYFDLLISSIFQAENTLALTANIILLYYVIKRMNAQNLRSKFSAFQQLTSDLLKKYLNSSNVSFIRFLLKSYCIFLKEQDLQEWENSITRTGFVQNLLVLIVHKKSRIRKVAKDSVVQLFVKIDDKSESTTNEQLHPIFEITTEFARRKVKETSGEDITDALYVLNMWKEIIHLLPCKQLKFICEQLISLLALGNVLVFTSCMQIFENLFKSNCKHMNDDLNYKIILALYDHEPSHQEHQPLLAWCSVTKYAELKLFDLNKSLFIEHLSKLFGIYFNCLQSENQILRGFACQSINELLEKAIEAQDQFNPAVFIAIGESLRSFLAFKHAIVWRLIFKLYSTFFKLKGDQFEECIKRSFVKLLDLKGTECEEAKNLRFDYPIRTLIQHHGVAFVLDRISIEPDFSNYSLKNLWIVEILRQNVKKDKICNFTKYILIQAQKICPDLKQFTVTNDSPWLMAYVQLWSLLPVFVNEAIDVKENLKSIARTMGDGLKNAPPLRTFIMKALRQLIAKSNDEDLVEVKKYSKNYIPILLDLYVSDLTSDKGMKTTIYQTLIMFFSINDAALNETIYSKVIENKDAETNLRKKSLYSDILRCIVCNLKNKDKVVDAFESGLKSSENKDDKLEQKKAFRLVEELIKSPDNFKLICEHYSSKGQSLYDNIINYFAQNYSSVSILAAQASFTRIVQHVLNEQFKENKLSIDEFKRLVPIMITMLQSKKSAKLTCSVFGVLENCVELMNNGVNETINVLVDCLKDANNSIDRNATLIFILHNILIKYKESDKIDRSTKTKLIKALLSNLSNENRKIVNVILLFLNDWFKQSSKQELLPHISSFIDYLNSIENPCASKYKYKIKNLIEKIMKKFGVEIVTKMLDSKYQRLIKVMLKNERRDKREKPASKKKRRANEELDEEESDQESENEDHDKDDDDDDDDDDSMEDFSNLKSKQKQKQKKKFRF